MRGLAVDRYNRFRPLGSWILAAGATINATSDEVTLPASGSYADSGLILVSGAKQLQVSAECYADVASTTYPGQAVWYVVAYYYAADGVTAAYNTDPTPHTSNADAGFKYPLGTWTPVRPAAGAFNLGPNVIWVRVTIRAASSTQPSYKVRRPVLTIT